MNKKRDIGSCIGARCGVRFAAAVSAVALAAFLAGGCGGGMPKIPATPEAVLEKSDDYYESGKYFQAQELFKAFLSRYPGHDRSDYAQFMLAESYFSNEEYPMASVEYQILINNYGYSDYVDDALFKTGLTYFRESPKLQRDQQKTEDALSRFNQFVMTFPNSPLISEAEEYINQIHAKLAEKTYKTAYYYYRRKKPKAALIYFDKVIEKYKNNEFWARSAYLKAILMEQRGETEQAIACYELVLGYPEDLDCKADARARLGALRQ